MAVDPTLLYMWSPIPCWEVSNTRQEWVDEDGNFRASVQLMCDWERRWELFIDLHCSLYIDQDNPGTQQMKSWTYPTELNKDVQPPYIDPEAPNTVNRSIFWPRAYPDFRNDDRDPGDPATKDPTYQRIGVSTVKFASPPEKYDTDNNYKVIQPEHAYLDVEYEGRYNIMETLEYRTKYLNTDKQRLQWASAVTGPPAGDSDPIDIDSTPGPLETPSTILHEQVLTRRIKGVSPKELATILICVGRTNNEAYDSVQWNRTFPPQSLLMMDPVITPGLNWEGAESTTPDEINYPTELMENGFNVEVKFLFKEVEGIIQSELDTFGAHNYFWRPDRQRYVSSGTTGGVPVSSNNYGSWDRFKFALTSGPSTGFPFYRPFLPLPTVDRWLGSRPQLEPNLVFSPPPSP